MLFNSFEFLFIFLPITYIGYCLLNKFKMYKPGTVWLLIASLYFYAYYKIEYLPLILLSILFNYTIGTVLLKKDLGIFKKPFLVFGLIGNLGLLCYYKYWGFLTECFNNLFNQDYSVIHILLPLGISFFTFQQIAYIVDCYKKDAEDTDIIDYALFVTFFPQLISGPIIHHKEIIPQIKDVQKRTVDYRNISLAFFFITIGLAKKVLFADHLSPFFDETLQNTENLSCINGWMFALVTAMWGYFDFSGYCDMAIGLGWLFNIMLPANFNSPYQSTDISDYWRRWHITLGRFLKNYVYIPLGGSRRGTFKTYRNLFIVFLLTGIWHGANIPCLLYGVVNGVLVSLNKFWKTFKIEINHKFATFMTFATMVFIVPMIMIPQTEVCMKVQKAMIGLGNNFELPDFDNFNLIFSNDAKINIVLIILSLLIIFGCKNSNEVCEKYVNSNKVVYTALLAILFVVSTLAITKANTFIYFRF